MSSKKNQACAIAVSFKGPLATAHCNANSSCTNYQKEQNTQIGTLSSSPLQKSFEGRPFAKETGTLTFVLKDVWISNFQTQHKPASLCEWAVLLSEQTHGKIPLMQHSKPYKNCYDSIIRKWDHLFSLEKNSNKIYPFPFIHMINLSRSSGVKNKMESLLQYNN